MCYYRNYTPNYENTEAFYDSILEEINKSYKKMYLRKNKHPYNCKNTEQNIEVDHRTLFYLPDTDKNRVRAKYQEMLENGYTAQEVPITEKSVKIPHIHFCKVV